MLSEHSAQSYTVTLDDDPMVARIIEKTTGLKTVAFASAEQLLDEAERLDPAAVFVDIHLGMASGLDVIPQLRNVWPFRPLLVVTSDESDEVLHQALSAGADDFVRKPLCPSELNARLSVRMKDLSSKAEHNVVAFGDIALDRIHRVIKGQGPQKQLSSTEAELLATLIEARGAVVSRAELKRRLWGRIAVTDSALDRKIFDIRKTLKETSQTLAVRSIYGVGWALEDLGTCTEQDEFPQLAMREAQEAHQYVS